jgi:hypothetical protein
VVRPGRAAVEQLDDGLPQRDGIRRRDELIGGHVERLPAAQSIDELPDEVLARRLRAEDPRHAQHEMARRLARELLERDFCRSYSLSDRTGSPSE